MGRRRNSIRLSPKHGVNPGIIVCPICLGDTGVALFGALPGDNEAPRRSRDFQPCAKCQEHMKLGVILIHTWDPAPNETPRQSGSYVVVVEAYIRRVFTEELAEELLVSRRALLPDSMWKALGFEAVTPN